MIIWAFVPPKRASLSLVKHGSRNELCHSLVKHGSRDRLMFINLETYS